MDALRVRNLVTGRVYWVRGDHYAVSHPDFEVVVDVEDAPVSAPEAREATLESLSMAELRAFAEEQGVPLTGVRSKAAIIALIEEHS